MADLGQVSIREVGRVAPPPTDPAAGVGELGDFRLLREIGRGGMGIVYEAEQVSLGRRVALKLLPMAAALDPRQIQRFRVEPQAAACLHHPHIVPVHGVGCERGVHYYAMQLIDGRTLADLIGELRRAEGLDAPDQASRDDLAVAMASSLASGRLGEKVPAAGPDEATVDFGTVSPTDGPAIARPTSPDRDSAGRSAGSTRTREFAR